MTFSYGDIALEDVLDPVSQVISNFDKQVLNFPILQPLELNAGKVCQVEGPVDPLFDPDKQHKASLSWIVGDSNDIEDLCFWKALSLLLTYGHSSPLYKALIDSGIGTDFSPNTGAQDLPGKTIFSVGLQGISKTSIEQFKKSLFMSLDNIVDKGIEKSHLDSIINQLELSYREVDANFGLSILYKLISRVFNGADSFKVIDDKQMLDTFKKNLLENPRLFQDKVKKHLVDSPYFEFVMAPDENFEGKLESEEAQRLQTKIDELKGSSQSSNDESIAHYGEVSILPTLSTGDISPTEHPIEVKRAKSKFELFVRDTNTQGLKYVHVLKDLSNFPMHRLGALSLYSDAMMNVGTDDYSMAELENKIRLSTGGIDSSLHVRGDANDADSFKLQLLLSGSSHEDKEAFIYEYMHQVLAKPNFKNIDKLKQLIQANAANAMGALSQNGHRFAMRNAAAGLSRKSAVEEVLNGMEQIQAVQLLAGLDDNELSEIIYPLLAQIAKDVYRLPLLVGLTRDNHSSTNLDLDAHLTQLVGDEPYYNVKGEIIAKGG